MTAEGHEDPFPPPGLSGRYVIRQETLAGTRGNGQDAPIPGALHDEKLARAVSNAGRVVVVDLLAGLGQQREPIAPPPIFFPGSLSIRRSIVTPSGTGIRARGTSSSFTA